MKPKQYTVYIDPNLMVAFSHAAIDQDRSVSRLTADAMREYLLTRSLPCPPEACAQDRPAKGATVSTSELNSIVEALTEQANAILEMRAELSSLKTSSVPKPLDMPRGSFTNDEKTILNCIRVAGPKGILASDFQKQLIQADMRTQISKKITADLQRRNIIKKKRMHWEIV